MYKPALALNAQSENHEQKNAYAQIHPPSCIFKRKRQPTRQSGIMRSGLGNRSFTNYCAGNEFATRKEKGVYCHISQDYCHSCHMLKNKQLYIEGGPHTVIQTD
ncbi:hypothetical protein L3476_15675 [Paenibacillus thiaminolyticus]|uniref:hypothetical protein n=1 Tax=Paenibacillus thiaminolyticus TaxID=49283 RepID=UPI001162730D|nr:hypothetical protein [Paenibacillus thiaminolyticus]NGP61643.1 hypothetical protein [Paenibacillus thiaminolyticus]WCR24824.1 hypothetical protein L3476_15675 [Paenibacillus thiaminolyticus]